MVKTLSSIICHDITLEFIIYYFTLQDLYWRMTNGIYSQGNDNTLVVIKCNNVVTEACWVLWEPQGKDRNLIRG